MLPTHPTRSLPQLHRPSWVVLSTRTKQRLAQCTHGLRCAGDVDWLGLLLFKELIMTPTNKLRFVERDSYSKNGEFFLHPHKETILQQLWVSHWWPLRQVSEWRDVPLEKE